ncbi:MAG: imidazolonepropionase [Hyphomicrobiales bacterium]
MAVEKRVIRNCILATMTPGKTPYGLIENGEIVIEEGKIAWAGPAEDAPHIANCPMFNAEGRLVTPGLIDCHTHLVYGGNRAGEFEQRLNGVSYEEIAKKGGGILSTVEATRAASDEELLEAAQLRLSCLANEGVTTVEVKSGYGLDTETELRMLRAARKLGEESHVDIVTSFLGAHALPKEFANDRDGYIALVCDEMLPAVANKGLADAVDGFCEGIAFSAEEMRKVFEKATSLGLSVKLHAEQLSDLGGAKMAAGFGALSCDHIEYLGTDGVEAMAKAGSSAVLLPGAFYYLHETQKPPVEALRKAGVPIAVATDLNPGSSPVFSLLTTMNMACVLFGLNPEEALAGVTRSAARALGLDDRGVIAPGYRADFALWDITAPGELSYALGRNPCAGVIKDGDFVGSEILLGAGNG